LHHSSERDKRIAAAVAVYFDARKSGQPIDRNAFLARFEDLRGELLEFLADQDLVDQAAEMYSPQGETAIVLGQPLQHNPGANVPPPARGADRSSWTDLATGVSLAPGMTTNDESLPIAQSIPCFGDYEVLEEIARGGMGVVCKARQISLNRIVALKLILAGQLASKTDVQRFRAEAEAAANLDHPNILPIYEVGEFAGQQYFSMKLIEGGNLAQSAAFPLRRRVEIVVKIAHSVHYAHQRGILHRDLKPANVLLDRDGNPYVTDFGLAKRVEDDSGLTQSGAIVGTPSYMAPEQARAEKHLSTGVDVHSLGAILYEMIAGTPPFRSGNVYDTIKMVLEKEPAHPRAIRPNANRDLSTIALKCLHKDPARRYGSAEALAEDLERWLRGEPILARPVGKVERSLKWVKRNPVIAGMLAGIAALVSVGAIEIYLKYREAKHQKAEAETQTRIAKQNEERAKQNRQDLEYTLAQDKILLAQSAFENNNPNLARERLHQVPAPMRHWEWNYLRRKMEGGLFTLYGHQSSIAGVCHSPDGSRIVTAGMDAVKVWDARTGQLVRELIADRANVASVCYNPNGSLIATGMGENQLTLPSSSTAKTILAGEVSKRVKIWDAETGALLLELDEKSNVKCVTFSPDGKRIAVASSDKSARVWDARTGRISRNLVGHTAPVHGIAFSPDGMRIVTAGADMRAIIWDAKTGEPVLYLTRHTASLNSAAYSPDGKWIITASDDNSALIWDTHSGALVRELKGHISSVSGAVFSPDGTRITTASNDRTARIWDARTGLPLLELKGHTGPLHAVGFSPDGTRVVTGSGGDYTAKVWDAESGSPFVDLKGHSAAVVKARYSPDGTKIVTAGDDHTARLWDAKTGALLHEFHGHTAGLTGVDFLRNGAWIVSKSSDLTVKVWDAESGKILNDLRPRAGSGNQSGVDPNSRLPDMVRDPKTGGVVNVIAGGWNPEGSGFVGVDAQQKLKVWNAAGEAVFDLKEQTGNVTRAGYSPNGTWLVTASDDKTVKVWDARTGKLVHKLKGIKRECIKVCCSLDGARVVAASADKTIRVWNAHDDVELFELKGLIGKAGGVCYSPDGAEIVAFSEDFQPGKVWNAKTGALLHDLTRFAGQAYATVVGVGYASNRKWIVTAGRSYMSQVTYFEAKSGLELGIPDGGWSPDGTKVIATTFDGKVWRPGIWDVRTGTRLMELKGSTGRLGSADYTSDGARIVLSSTGLVQVFDAGTGAALFTVKDKQIGPISTVWAQVSVSPDGRKIVVGSADQVVKVWDVASAKELLELKGHQGAIASIRFSPDGNWIISAAPPRGVGGGSANVWDAATGVLLHDLKSGQPGFNPDGTPIKVRDAQTGIEIPTIEGGWTANGARVLAARRETLQVWDASEGVLELELRGHSDDVLCACFSPDGRRIVSGGKDRTVKIWDAKTGIPLLDLKGHPGGIRSIAFSPDETRILAASEDGMVRIWEGKNDFVEHNLKGQVVRVTNFASFRNAQRRYRIVTGIQESSQTVWDADSGQELPNEMPSKGLRPGGSRPDGKLFAFYFGGHVEFIDLNLTAEEREARLFWTRPRPDRHREEFERAVRTQDFFAARFHLNCLLTYDVKNRERWLAERVKLQGDDHLLMARTAIHSPKLVKPDIYLVALGAWKWDPLALRLLGGLLLRQGKPAEAISPLKLALLLRGPGKPPVEELLLSIAYLDAGQRDESGRWHAQALDWLNRKPKRVALAPNQELNWESWYECEVLRAEAEARWKVN
jgi:WD40 repeat protein/serine/threonine protein kinase